MKSRDHLVAWKPSFVKIFPPLVPSLGKDQTPKALQSKLDVRYSGPVVRSLVVLWSHFSFSRWPDFRV